MKSDPGHYFFTLNKSTNLNKCKMAQKLNDFTINCYVSTLVIVEIHIFKKNQIYSFYRLSVREMLEFDNVQI